MHYNQQQPVLHSVISVQNTLDHKRWIATQEFCLSQVFSSPSKGYVVLSTRGVVEGQSTDEGRWGSRITDPPESNRTWTYRESIA